MIELHWGHPISLVVSPQGDTKQISTIEQAFFWLRKKWPVADDKRDLALDRIDDAMHCLATVDAARGAFLSAARSAGFVPRRVAAEPAAGPAAVA
ncbi:DUF982 domain-containing protein [Aquicoccus sp. SU-CL01552]|uniref:DUF982 domain-containing protein n=1 Tax=Aquicoccus sp. SU-CL01552 TaxID=3127656 RepID=UPI003101C9D5